MKDRIKSILKLKYMSAFVFFAFIGIMLLLFIALPKKTFLTDEKRVAEPAPVFTWETLRDGTFGENAEKYISDHFTARRFFVGLHAYYSLASGRGGTADIYNAEDGFLINAPIEFNRDNLNKNIDKINKFAESVNARVHLCIVPATGYVLEDKLPPLHMPYYDDNIFAGIRKRISEAVGYIDLTTAFKDNAGAEKLYYRTDHHWTTAGAYEGYVLICGAMGIMPKDRDSYNIERYDGFYGTTYSQSGYWLTKPDTLEIWKSDAQSNAEVSIIEGGKVQKQQTGLYFTEHLNEPDMYPVFLDGNHPYIKIINESAPEGRLIVIKDSFAHCLVPFFTEHFREIDMIDLRYYKGSAAELITSDKDEVLIIYGIDNFVNDTNFPWLTRGLGTPNISK